MHTDFVVKNGQFFPSEVRVLNHYFFIDLNFCSVCLCCLVRSLLIYTHLPESFTHLAMTVPLSSGEPNVLRIGLGLLLLVVLPIFRACTIFTKVSSILVLRSSPTRLRCFRFPFLQAPLSPHYFFPFPMSLRSAVRNSLHQLVI